MSIFGSPSPEFAQPVSDSQSLKEAYDLLFAAWEMIEIDLATTPTKNLENTITWRFYGKIEMEKARRTDNGERQYYFSFHPGSSVIDRGKQVGISDLQIQFGYDERRRFTLEAKLLNKPKGSNIGEYVGYDGMDRFLRDGKYGIGVSAGGMMGYVLDGNTNGAKQKVTNKIEESRLTLGMSHQETLKKSSLRKDIYETFHTRQTKTVFTIYHIFLPVR